MALIMSVFNALSVTFAVCCIQYVLCQYTTIWMDTMEANANWNYSGTVSWVKSSSYGQCATNPCHYTHDNSWISRETDVSMYSSLRVNYTSGSQQLEVEKQCRLYYSYTNHTLTSRKLIHFNQGMGDVWTFFGKNVVILPDASTANTAWLWFETWGGGSDYCYWDDVSLEGIIMPSTSAFPSIDPTVAPSNDPTAVPSRNPTNHPTVAPTNEPTMIPSGKPTSIPTARTLLPTTQTQPPTRDPTALPSNPPTDAPSATLREGMVKLESTELKAVFIQEPVTEENGNTALLAVIICLSVFIASCLIVVKVIHGKRSEASVHSANMQKQMEDGVSTPETKTNGQTLNASLDSNTVDMVDTKGATAKDVCDDNATRDNACSIELDVNVRAMPVSLAEIPLECLVTATGATPGETATKGDCTAFDEIEGAQNVDLSGDGVVRPCTREGPQDSDHGNTANTTTDSGAV
eukprot:175514_1